MWRALRAQEQLDAAAFRRMMEARVQNLSLGWTVTETEETETEEAKTAQPKPLSAKRRNMMGRHGTQVLSAVKIMEPCREHSGIAIQVMLCVCSVLLLSLSRLRIRKGSNSLTRRNRSTLLRA
jgi:hypothetical protein